MSNDKEFVWVIAGGILQLPIIREIKKRGYKVIVSDRNPHAPGCLEADMAIEVDTYDVESHIEIAESMKTKPIAVLTAGADVGPTVSAIAEILGLPSVSYEVASRCRNKYAMREALGHKHPVYLRIDPDPTAINSLWKRKCAYYDISPYPCVLKPLEGSGTRGISLVESPWKWNDAIKKARFMFGKHKQLIVEEYLERAEEVATEFFVENDRLYFANAAKRYFHSNHFGLEAGHTNPWEPTPTVRQLAKDAVECLGVDWGPFKIDFMLDNRYGWVVLETATRLSGGFDHMLTAPLATGRDITGAMIDVALGEKLPKTNLRASKEKFACAWSPIMEAGKIEKWILPDDMPGQVDIIVLSKDEIEPIENCTQRPVFVIAEGKTEKEALKNAQRIAGEIRVEYEREPVGVGI